MGAGVVGVPTYGTRNPDALYTNEYEGGIIIEGGGTERGGGG